MKYPYLAVILLIVSMDLRADISFAMKAYEHGDYITAYNEFYTLAESGHIVAQYNLAFLYYEGQGVTQNLKKAAFWFNQSARAGYAPAQDTLAYMFNHGIGLPQDSLRAYVWYSLASNNGIFLAQTIQNKLAKELSKTERIQADLMIREYESNYKVLD